LGEKYVKAIVQAGGTPLLVPPDLPAAQRDALLSRLDGILLSGGGDIDPALYGMETTPKVTNISPARDSTEIWMLKAAASKGLPFLGICRGLQVINVALGGTLYTDIATQRPNAIKHDYYPESPRDLRPHTVAIEPESRLCRILGLTETPVNSLHHQGIRDLAEPLQPAAFAPDGLVESIELPEHPFGLGVQWHPEWLTAYAPMRALFRAFVEAAAQ
jgi:putative glutamine amidotransferase